MKTIWKFPLEQTVEMPTGARILSCAMQHGRPCLWAMVDPDAPKVRRRLKVRGTGHDIMGDEGDFVGSILDAGGALVWHVFAVPEAA